VTDDQREQYEERAAIAEYDGGLSRQDAEEMAKREISGVKQRANAGEK